VGWEVLSGKAKHELKDSFLVIHLQFDSLCHSCVKILY